ncbi:MAG: rhomboid family intramembrane serine protease [Methylocystis sp.]|uniref:rhomboid family intramembrane serine protease n=1 Tax=Methylocystis sp. TaxID=1911079 RepID=UPI003D13675A
MVSATQQAAPAVQIETDQIFFQLRESRGRLLAWFLISLVFVAIGVAMVSNPRPSQPDAAFGIMAVVFFGLGGLVLLGRLIASGRATAILTHEGVTYPAAYDGVLPWGAVQNYECVERGKSRVLIVTPYPHVADDMSWKGFTGWTSSLYGKKSPAGFAIPLNSRREDEARFLDVFSARVGAAKAAQPEDSHLRQIDARNADVAARAQAHESQSEAEATFPYVTAGLTALLALIFFAELGLTNGSSGDAMSPSIETLVQFGGVFRSAVDEGQWLRIFTAPLLHANFEHLALNCISLWIVGVRFERYVGSGWFAAVFAGSAIAGSLMSVAFNPPNLVSVGASGGIVGLFAATALASRHFPPGRMRTLMATTAVQTLLPSLIPLITAPGGNKIDYAAHFGGALGGAALGFALLALWPQALTRPRFGKVAAIGAGLYALIGVGAVISNNDVPEQTATRPATAESLPRLPQSDFSNYRLPDSMARSRAPLQLNGPSAPPARR